ncbi:MAG: rod shape-determining protein RodA [Betaproteobacteria bacterium]|nr:rod shape-determining protein RodA [Betaproteobacteria bacterium]
MISAFVYRLTRGLDGPLLIIVGLLMAAGLAAVFSATLDAPARFKGQLLNMAVAYGVMWMVAQIRPPALARFALPLYVVGVLLLVAVALFGDVSKGARRWLHVGFTRIQPSEIMKIAVPLMLAWYFQQREATLRLRDYGVAALLLAVPVVLIVRQPDLGTAMLVLAAGFYVIFLAGLSWRVMFALAVTAGASLPLVWTLLHDYQRRRVLTLLDPASDPLGAGYHIIQSTIAVGSGGALGKGWLHGTQTHLEFIPERHTDFILAVFAEEFGLVGSLLLLLLYLALIVRGLMIASNAPTMFTRLLAGSVTLIFFTYAFVNIGMVSGVLPVVGVPLPFISYGGTALVTLFLGVGILLSINRHRMLVPK